MARGGRSIDAETFNFLFRFKLNEVQLAILYLYRFELYEYCSKLLCGFDIRRAVLRFCGCFRLFVFFYSVREMQTGTRGGLSSNNTPESQPTTDENREATERGEN